MKSVYSHAFSGCVSLKIVTVRDGVERIGDGAFAECVSLRSVTLPASVTKLGEDVFLSCPDSLTVTVPPGSEAERYCAENGVRYQYQDALD